MKLDILIILSLYQYTINTPVQIAQQNSQYSYVTEPGDYMLIGWVIR